VIFGGSLVIFWYKHQGPFSPVLLRRSQGLARLVCGWQRNGGWVDGRGGGGGRSAGGGGPAAAALPGRARVCAVPRQPALHRLARDAGAARLRAAISRAHTDTRGARERRGAAGAPLPAGPRARMRDKH